jgi:hypothetical protein
VLSWRDPNFKGIEKLKALEKIKLLVIKKHIKNGKFCG